MRTNKTLRIASVLLIAVLMTACVIGGTLAKYTSTISTAESTASVATWNVTVTDADGETDGIQFNLIDTVLDTNGGAAETDVKAGKIAPGTKGSFSLGITNASEVNATGTIVLTITNANNVPIKFYSDEDMTQELTVTEGKITIDGIALAMEAAAPVNTPIYWQWAFADTDESSFAGSSLTVKADITVTQVD